MSVVSYAQLHNNRVRWMPRREAYGYTNPSPELYDFLLRSIALGLNLELPVGAMIASATKSDLPVSADAMTLLRANIGDESLHNMGFQFLGEAYPEHARYMDEAAHITKSWADHDAHPIQKAGLCEAGVFLIGLGIIRFASPSAALLAAHVGADEQRHVSTNVGVTQDIGINPYSPPPSLDRIREESLAWLMQDQHIPSLGIDIDWALQQSKLLVAEGCAPELQELTDFATYMPPFESGNETMY